MPKGTEVACRVCADKSHAAVTTRGQSGIPWAEPWLSTRTNAGSRKRVPLGLVRFLIAFSMGVAATVAWQPHGDAAREMLASSSSQVRWLAPRAEQAAQNASETIALVAPAVAPPSPNQQQLSAISLDPDAVRQSIDRLSNGQEQMTRNVDQLAAGQAQITGEITKLQAIGQYILYKNSEPGRRRRRP
jgi:PPE-repeat protein